MPFWPYPILFRTSRAAVAIISDQVQNPVFEVLIIPRIALRRARRSGSACAIVALPSGFDIHIIGVGARHNQASPLEEPVARDLAPYCVWAWAEPGRRR